MLNGTGVFLKPAGFFVSIEIGRLDVNPAARRHLAGRFLANPASIRVKNSI